MDVQAKVVEIIAEQGLLNTTDVTLDARLTDLGIDSLGIVEAVFAIEEAFNIAVPFNANGAGAHDTGAGFDMTTVGSIVAAVQGLIAQRAA
jgi:acyl carrier protein